jgi:DNA-binding beta-propeller fold protein YncE
VLRTISQGVYFPCAVALDASGNLYVANYGSSTVAVFPPGGSQPSRTITAGLRNPSALALDPAGNLFVTNVNGGKRYSGSVTVYRRGDAKPSLTITKELVNPSGSALGPSGELYVVDLCCAKIVVFPKGSTTPDRAITRGIYGPSSIAFDKSGNLYVANLNSTVTEYRAGTNKLIRTIPPAKGYPPLSSLVPASENCASAFFALVGAACGGDDGVGAHAIVLDKFHRIAGLSEAIINADELDRRGKFR